MVGQFMTGHVHANESRFAASQPLAHPSCAHARDSRSKYAPPDLKLESAHVIKCRAVTCVSVPCLIFPCPIQTGTRIQFP
jgi:hypothetical protein